MASFFISDLPSTRVDKWMKVLGGAPPTRCFRVNFPFGDFTTPETIALETSLLRIPLFTPRLSSTETRNSHNAMTRKALPSLWDHRVDCAWRHCQGNNLASQLNNTSLEFASCFLRSFLTIICSSSCLFQTIIMPHLIVASCTFITE